MSLLKKEKKVELVQLNVRLDSEAADKLKRYAEFLESTQAYVMSQAIHYIVDRDREFQQFTEKQLAGMEPDPLADLLVRSPEKELADSVPGSPQRESEILPRTAKAAGK